MRLLLLSLFAVVCWSQSKLPSFNADIHESTISGLSSGGFFFAVQMHVAFSSTFAGAAIFAGGPYDCAEGSEEMAFQQCMYAFIPPNFNKFVKITDTRVASKLLDPTSNLATSRVYMFSGTVDTTVKQTVMDSLYSYYTHYISNVSAVYYEKTMKAAHTFPTDESINLNPCTLSITPYISNCNYDGAGVALNHLYDNLMPRNNGTLTGQFIQFDQSQFLPNPTSKGLASTGYAYVPAACASGSACKIHISLHGCAQNYESVQMKYVQNTGFNKWADTNNIVVLYPQTHKSEIFPANPEGCWDWWGFDGASTYDTNQGVQMKAIYAMLVQATSG